MSSESSGTGPILCAHLLRKVDENLIELLRSLSPSEWDAQTVVLKWKVRDVAAHPARHPSCANCRSCETRGTSKPVNIQSPQDVVTLVNRLNEEGVTVYRV
jgi:hypothetical protein